MRLNHVWIEESPKGRLDHSYGRRTWYVGTQTKEKSDWRWRRGLPKAHIGLGQGRELPLEAGGGWNAKKIEKQGSKRTDRGLEVQDGVGWACWKKLGTGKWVMRPHMPALGIQVVGEKWRVGGAWVGFWLRCFEKSCRSPLCALDDVVGVGKSR